MCLYIDLESVLYIGLLMCLIIIVEMLKKVFEPVIVDFGKLVVETSI